MRTPQLSRPLLLSCRRKSRVMLIGTLAFTLTTAFVAAGNASACIMSTYAPPPSPAKLLAQAGQNLRHGRRGAAAWRAREILQARRATAIERAGAWTVLAWYQMGRGDRTEALQSLARARQLDGTTVATILTVSPSDSAIVALRQANKV